MNKHKTDPLLIDTDSDGLSDGYEIVSSKTEPLNEDTDGDGVADGIEVKEGTDPNDPNDSFNLNEDLIAYYPFSGNTKDESGNGYTMVIENDGPKLGEDRFGRINGAMVFTKYHQEIKLKT